MQGSLYSRLTEAYVPGGRRALDDTARHDLRAIADTATLYHFVHAGHTADFLDRMAAALTKVAADLRRERAPKPVEL